MSGVTDVRVRLPLEVVLAYVNRDPEWNLVARFWTARIEFLVDDERCLMTVENGRAVAFEPAASASSRSTLRIGGAFASWRELLGRCPARSSRHRAGPLASPG